MTLGHEICHVLHDGEADGTTVGIISNDWAPYLIERRANAFAAMLLAPEPAMSECSERRPRLWVSKDLEHAMRELGIGATTLLQQLRNLRWISDRQRNAWLDELTRSDRWSSPMDLPSREVVARVPSTRRGRSCVSLMY